MACQTIIQNGLIVVPDTSGLGIESLNNEFIAAHLAPDNLGMWEPTDAWNVDYSNVAYKASTFLTT